MVIIDLNTGLRKDGNIKPKKESVDLNRNVITVREEKGLYKVCSYK